MRAQVDSTELGVPDRYVDLLKDRVLQSVIRKFYAGKELERLKRTHEKSANDSQLALA